jgi:hypothetical protein
MSCSIPLLQLVQNSKKLCNSLGEHTHQIYTVQLTNAFSQNVLVVTVLELKHTVLAFCFDTKKWERSRLASPAVNRKQKRVQTKCLPCI